MPSVTPTMGGYPIFGEAPRITTKERRENQVNGFPLVDGLQVVRLGKRGGMSVVSGVLVGATLADLAAAEAVWRDLYLYGLPTTLVDTVGTTWLGVMVDDFDPQEGVMGDDIQGYAREYRALLLHLISG